MCRSLQNDNVKLPIYAYFEDRIIKHGQIDRWCYIFSLSRVLDRSVYSVIDLQPWPKHYGTGMKIKWENALR